MENENYSFIVDKKISKDERINWHLYVDAIYKSDPQKKTNYSSEVLSKLLSVKNDGGIRYIGSIEKPKLVVLCSSGKDIYWKDELDSTTGILLYYGDNKTPGNDLHETNIHGNEILRVIFNLASSSDFEKRKSIPPILVFRNAGGYDRKFWGLVVPGIKGKPSKDWLTAVWGCNRNGDRFLNYKAYFTVLNTASGSEEENGFGINLAWLNDIEKGNAFESVHAPKEWKKYISNKNYASLMARNEKYVKNAVEQLPDSSEKLEMLNSIHDFFIEKDHGYSFESFAVDIAQGLDSAIVDLTVTQPYKDGGIDAIGTYQLFKMVENVVYVDFYLQAKCYDPTKGLAVKDTSRLISRIKNRQFGVLITTSYVCEQAYKEVLEDGHPVVFITGKNIIDYIYDELEIRSLNQLKNWLNNNYS